MVAGEIDFLHGGDVGDVGAEGILEPADSFDAALAGGGGDVGEDVVAAELGGASAVEDGVFVVLRMDGGVISAGEGAGVVLLLAVVGEGLAGDLATGDAATVGKGGEEKSVDVGILLEVVENFFCSFIDEGDGADLDAYGFFIGESSASAGMDDGYGSGGRRGRLRLSGSGGVGGIGKRCCEGGCCGVLKESSAIHVSRRSLMVGCGAILSAISV